MQLSNLSKGEQYSNHRMLFKINGCFITELDIIDSLISMKNLIIFNQYHRVLSWINGNMYLVYI